MIDMEYELSNFKTIRKFDKLINKVCKDQDKKSTYSKKLESEFKREQDKQ